MNEQTKNIIEEQVNYWGLENYKLATYAFHRDGKTSSIQLSLEFFPKGSTPIYEDGEIVENPSGTISMVYDLQKKQVIHYIVVHNETFVTKQLFFEKTVEEVAQWIEEQTGLQFQKHFIAVEGSSSHFIFKGALNQILTADDMTIHVKYDEQGRLLWYSKHGNMNENARVEEKKFTLTLEAIESLVKERVTLIHLPVDEERAFIPLYTVEEAFIHHENHHMFSVENNVNELNHTLKWKQGEFIELVRNPIEIDQVLDDEEAFSTEGIVKNEPLSEEEIEQVIALVEKVMATLLPEQSDQWVLRSLEQMGQYLMVTNERLEETPNVLKRKVKVMIHRSTMTLQNYMDNEELLMMFDTYDKASQPKITKEHAFTLLLPFISLEPYYVYNEMTDTYELCGLLQAAEAIDAITGEPIIMER